MNSRVYPPVALGPRAQPIATCALRNRCAQRRWADVGGNQPICAPSINDRIWICGTIPTQKCARIKVLIRLAGAHVYSLRYLDKVAASAAPASGRTGR
jgi:hypothetical protein